jgi:hypothetical protein
MAITRTQSTTKPARLCAPSLLSPGGRLLQRRCGCDGAPGMDEQENRCQFIVSVVAPLSLALNLCEVSKASYASCNKR